MSAKVPAITGVQLIRLLKKDGWTEKRRTKHGIGLVKSFQDRTRVTVVPPTRASLDTGTLAAILAPKQTRITKAGLLELISKYGL